MKSEADRNIRVRGVVVVDIAVAVHIADIRRRITGRITKNPPRFIGKRVC